MENEKKVLDEEGLCDLILCDPFTDLGVSALTKLDLQNEITPDYFMKKVWVDSQYGEAATFVIPNEEPDSNVLNGQYTVTHERFLALKQRRNEFNQRFHNNDKQSCSLFILGVVGNGKSIEVRKRIYDETQSLSLFSSKCAYFNLDSSKTEVTYETEYKCPDPNNALWLFCVKLLDGLMMYIQTNYDKCSLIWENCEKTLRKKHIVTKEQFPVFEAIKDYGNGTKSLTAFFDSLLRLVNNSDPEDTIQKLLKILMLIMFCCSPKERHYIVFDNIEEYIHLDSAMIQIPNVDISKIYLAIRRTITNVGGLLDRIEVNLAWKTYKVIVALRRTSLYQLNPMPSPENEERKNIHDVTGYIQVKDIWRNKKENVWEPFLSAKYDENSKYLIELADYVMLGGDGGTGTEYQLLIAALMSHGIRRNAQAQARAIYGTYKILSDSSEATIDRGMFDELKNENQASRYMLRRALIEFQIKRAILPGKENRWGYLNIGHLVDPKDERGIGTEKIEIHHVEFYDNHNVSLLRRVLTYLSIHPEAQAAEGDGVSMIDMYKTVSLYDVITNVFTNPRRVCNIGDTEYSQLARVILAICNMSLKDTKGSPFAILSINDTDFHANSNVQSLASILKRIKNAGEAESLPKGIYNANDYGIRIIEAGISFLLDWEASYSLFSSLYCYDFPPLFFLREKKFIKHVIETVYRAADDFCQLHEDEARSFCPFNCNLFNDDRCDRFVCRMQ